jgi:pilus assembly protein FimV
MNPSRGLRQALPVVLLAIAATHLPAQAASPVAGADLAELREGVAAIEATLASVRVALDQRPAAPAPGQTLALAMPVTAAALPERTARADELDARQPALDWGQPFDVRLVTGLVAVLLSALAVRAYRRRVHPMSPAPGRDRMQSARGTMSDRISEPPPSTLSMGLTTAMTSTELKSVLTGATLTVGDRMGAVAEAELFLSYGRTNQAEQVLREAISDNPSDMESILCLLEILASGRQVAAFNELAAIARQTTGDSGPLWKQVAALGRSTDPHNPLYREERLATAPQVWVNFLGTSVGSSRPDGQPMATHRPA